MKIKTDYITNSSSASFTIAKKFLSEFQIMLIKDHIEVGYALTKTKAMPDLDLGWADEWSIIEIGDEIHGSTSMDNFDMYAFLNAIGIPDGVINYVSNG